MADDEPSESPPDSTGAQRNAPKTPDTAASDEASFGGRDLIGLGASLAGAVIGGMVLGILIDNQAGTTPTFALIGITAGIALGAFGFWVRVRRALRG